MANINKSNYIGTLLFRKLSGISNYTGVSSSAKLFASDIQGDTNASNSRLGILKSFSSDIQAETNTGSSSFNFSKNFSSSIQADTNISNALLVIDRAFSSSIQTDTNTSVASIYIITPITTLNNTFYSGTALLRKFIVVNNYAVEFFKHLDIINNRLFVSDIQADTNTSSAELQSYPILASDIKANTSTSSSSLSVPKEFNSDIKADTFTSTLELNSLISFTLNIEATTNTSVSSLEVSLNLNLGIQASTNITILPLIVDRELSSGIEADTDLSNAYLNNFNSSIQASTNTAILPLIVAIELSIVIRADTSSIADLSVPRVMASTIAGITSSFNVASHYFYEDALWLYVNDDWVYSNFVEDRSHWYKFYAVKNQEYEIFTGESDIGVIEDTQIFLHSRMNGLVPSQSLIDSNDDYDSTGLSKIIWTCDRTGIYYVSVNIKDGVLGSCGIRVTADIVNFVCPFLSHLGGRGELIEVNCIRYKCDLWIKEFYKCFITHYNDTLNHVHSTVWHQLPHKCEDLTEELGKKAPEALPVATVLHSEFIGKEDLDEDNEVYGVDFRIVNDEKLPPVLRSLMGSKDFIADKEVTLQSLLGKYFSSDIKAKTKTTNPGLVDIVAFRTAIIVSVRAEAKLTVGLLTSIIASVEIVEALLITLRPFKSSIRGHVNTSNAEIDQYVW